MGFVHQRKTYRLLFEGDLEGLEVVARSASARMYTRIAALANREWSNPLSAEDLAEFEALCVAFAKVLESWNLEEPTTVKGRPARRSVPATLDGLLDQDLELVTAIVLAWMDAVAGPAAVAFDESTLSQEALP